MSKEFNNRHSSKILQKFSYFHSPASHILHLYTEWVSTQSEDNEDKVLIKDK